MIVKDVDREALDRALAHANRYFSDNVTWNRKPTPLNNSNTRWRLTLRVKSSKGPGHRVGLMQYRWNGNGGEVSDKQRRLISACWHVHGVFFDSILRQGGTIQTGRAIIDCFGANWEDIDVGPQIMPQYMSELCDCDEDLAQTAYDNTGID